jgi:hypothetical protein
LECVCELAEEKGKAVLPSIDHGRVGHFIGFWTAVAESPPWLQSVLGRLKPLYGAGKRRK